MGNIFYTSVFNRSVAASSGLGVPIFNIKAGTGNSVLIREVRIGGVAGAASQPQVQTFTVRCTRNATVYATEGGIRPTVENIHPLGSSANATVRAGITAAAAATEGGRLLFADTYVGGNGSWCWAPPRDLAPWANISKNLAVLFHATDTTVVNATIVHEELSRAG
jgi:hypothetical protein